MLKLLAVWGRQAVVPSGAQYGGLLKLVVLATQEDKVWGGAALGLQGAP